MLVGDCKEPGAQLLFKPSAELGRRPGGEDAMIRILEQFISLGTLVRNLDAFLPTTIEGTSPENFGPESLDNRDGKRKPARRLC